jgi:hypothetical protein
MVFKEVPMPLMDRYYAEVNTSQGTMVNGEPYIFLGIPMGTTELAIQIVAVEAIARLRHLLPRAGEEQAFQLYHFVINTSQNIVFPSAD